MAGPGYPVTTDTHKGTTVTAVSSTIVDAAAKRCYLMIRNQGSVAIWIRLDGEAAVADKTSLMLLPGEPYELHMALPAGIVTAITASGTCDVNTISGAPPA